MPSARSPQLFTHDLLRQYAADASLLKEENVGGLLKANSFIAPDISATTTLSRFNDDPQLTILPVVADNLIPVGLITRSLLIELFSRQYSRELFGKRPISDFMNRSPLIVEKHTSVDDCARLIIEAGMHYMAEGFIVTFEDQYIGIVTGHDLLEAIIERKQTHLHRLAHFDALTNLPNRVLFRERLQHKLLELKRSELSASLIFIDLDRFKFINDSLGHHAGDLLLKEVAQRLATSVRETDTVARLSGDEFVILLDKIIKIHHAELIAEKILRTLRLPYVLEGEETTVTASLGIVMIDKNHDDIDQVIKYADTAMYYAKTHGKNSYQVFRQNLSDKANRLLQIEAGLRRAIERSEFDLVYQPILYSDHSLYAVEALIRWTHAELKDVSPNDFIPIAEEIGLINEVGQWVYTQVFAHMQAWQQREGIALRVSLNISGKQLASPGFYENFTQTRQQFAIEGQALILEITESSLMSHAKRMGDLLARLKADGIEIAIDDFGTGYSSLAQLKNLSIDLIKIDRTFLQGVPDIDKSSAFVKAILALGHSLEIPIIAEGIETEQQMQFCQDHLVQYVQGYHLSKPLNRDELLAFIR